jgi:hypothetical protein
LHRFGAIPVLGAVNSPGHPPPWSPTRNCTPLVVNPGILGCTHGPPGYLAKEERIKRRRCGERGEDKEERIRRRG